MSENIHFGSRMRVKTNAINKKTSYKLYIDTRLGNPPFNSFR